MSDLPVGWVETTLGDVCTVVSGSTPKSAEEAYWSGDISWITPDDLSRHTGKSINVGRRSITQAGLESCSAQMVPAGTVLYTSRAPIGYVAIAGRPVCTNQGFKSLVPPAGIRSDYLYWYMHYVTAEVRARASGTTFAEISGKAIKAVPLRLAPFAEQERIVAAIEEQFSRLDAGVAILERVRKNLKRMRASALNRLLHDSNGVDWPQVEMGDVLVRGRYGTSTKCSFEGHGLPVLRIPNVQSGFISLENLKFATDLSVELTGTLATENNILIIRTNGSRSLIGRAAVVPALPQPTSFASYLIQLEMNPEVVNPAYIVAALTSPRLRIRIEELAATTAGQYNISLSKLRSLRIPLPPLDEQQRALGEVEDLLSLAHQMELALSRSLTMSSSMRSAILAEAFAGKLVPQDPNDEPASVLLERIAAEPASSNGHKPTRSRNQHRKKAIA